MGSSNINDKISKDGLQRDVTIAIIGFGGRGRMYSSLINSVKGFKLTAVIDSSTEKLATAKKTIGLSDDCLFSNIDDFLATEKKAQWLFVCTQDKYHHEHTIKALKCGYDILLEKPIATTVADCLDIEKTAKELNRQVVVCHVLRYSYYFEKIAEIMNSGKLGKIIAIDQVENVAYWHQAHAFVRGDWGNTADSTPMILSKCCHDLDIAVYLANSHCETVVSSGRLNYFNKANAPKGITEYCVGGCASKKECPYDAEKLYIDRCKRYPKSVLKNAWPQSRLMTDGIVTIPKLREAIKNTRYGKCVFLSDNDAVDYQITTINFANGITSTLTMTAFSKDCYRETRVRGTLGELICDMDKNKITIALFGKKKKVIKCGRLLGAHGGGDANLLRSLKNGEYKTDVNQSIESHLIGFAAEHSRINGNIPVKTNDYRTGKLK